MIASEVVMMPSSSRQNSQRQWHAFTKQLCIGQGPVSYDGKPTGVDTFSALLSRRN